jgi:hypothetical protein
MSKVVVTGIVLLVLGCGCFALAADGAAVDKTAVYSDIRARVMGVERLTYPHVRLRLEVTQSSNPKVLVVKGRSAIITVENLIRLTSGRVDFYDKQNTDSIGAYYLLQGDEINGKLIDGVPDYIYGISRVPQTAASVAKGTVVVGGLKPALTTERSSYKVGEAVPLTFSVTNTQTSSRILKFASGQEFDIEISRDGREVWRWSNGKMFPQMVRILPLGPGEVLQFKETWDQQDNEGHLLAPGDYMATAYLKLMGAEQPVAPSLKIKIKAR